MMSVLQDQHLNQFASTWDSDSAFCPQFLCHPRIPTVVRLAFDEQIDTPNSVLFPTPVPREFFSSCVYHKNPASGWPYRFRSRRTTGSVWIQDDSVTAFVSENTIDSRPVRSRCAFHIVELVVGHPRSPRVRSSVASVRTISSWHGRIRSKVSAGCGCSLQWNPLPNVQFCHISWMTCSSSRSRSRRTLLLAVCNVAIHLVHANTNLLHSQKIDRLWFLSVGDTCRRTFLPHDGIALFCISVHESFHLASSENPSWSSRCHEDEFIMTIQSSQSKFLRERLRSLSWLGHPLDFAGHLHLFLDVPGLAAGSLLGGVHICLSLTTWMMSSTSNYVKSLQKHNARPVLNIGPDEVVYCACGQWLQPQKGRGCSSLTGCQYSTSS